MDSQKVFEAQQELLKKLHYKINENIQYSQPKAAENVRKKRGIYYSPPDIAFYICFQAITYNLFKFLQEKLKTPHFNLEHLTPAELHQILEHIKTLKILDPSCGSGVFLVQAAETLYIILKWVLETLGESINSFKLKRNILENNIFGVDYFEDAISDSKTLLIQWISSGVNSLQENSLLSHLNSNINIRLGNSLIGWLDEDLGALTGKDSLAINQELLSAIFPGKTHEAYETLELELARYRPLHWPIIFPSIIEGGGFDIIVGNPPYVFIRGKTFSSFEKQFYKQKYLKSHQSLAKGKAKQSRKMNLFSLFIIRGFQLLKAGGYLGFIVPNTILRTTTNDFIRQFILENTHIEEIVDLKEGIFKGITASTILLFLQKIKPSTQRTHIHHNVQDLLKYQYKSHIINQTRFKKNPVFVFNIHLAPELEKVFESFKESTFELGAITKEIIEGIVCRKRDNLFSQDPAHPLARKLLRGKNIGRYQIHWPENQYILYATDTSLTEKKLHRPRPQWVHDAPEKFLSQRIGGGLYPLKVAYDNSQYYTFASINNIIFKEPPTVKNQEYLPKYIMAILNSKLMNSYYLLNYSNLSSLTVNISKTFLESLPIKKCKLEAQRLIAILVEYLLFLYKTPKKVLPTIEFFDNWVLDSMIYEIYFQNHLGTNLLESLANFLRELPPNAPPEKKIQIISQSLLNIQQSPLILELLSKIKRDPSIKKIEYLFQERTSRI